MTSEHALPYELDDPPDYELTSITLFVYMYLYAPDLQVDCVCPLSVSPSCRV